MKCFAVKVVASQKATTNAGPASLPSARNPVNAGDYSDADQSSSGMGTSGQGATNLVPQSIMDAIKLEFDDVFQLPPDGLPPDRGTGHLIPLVPDQKAPYRNPYRLSLQRSSAKSRNS